MLCGLYVCNFLGYWEASVPRGGLNVGGVG